MNPTIYTIGHSNGPALDFISNLKRNGITAVGDVRSSPFSRYVPHFNQDTLKTLLAENGIAYVFLGKELGARSEDPCCYVDGRVSYERLATTELFQRGIDRVLEGAQKYRLALMCAEKDPCDCHRTILVARALERQGVDVQHILSLGQLESHAETMRRLMASLKIPTSDLFMSPEALVEQAYATRGKQISYSPGA
ncbi:DUF488 family protein [Salipiger sp. PrR003]|uniref:DUF488 domain-containing protein n=1 Tax=Salipiger sp. PrR003 TaxID=2706776 RepID=UPI0013DA86C7|nr:DUF488 domain-containing protein [Salipiger sp. PrR003]NDV51543.1 DUF488 domain-containing protein [Salipiger sp. PrR003]